MMMAQAEAEKLIAVVNKVVADHGDEQRISPTWIATEVMQLIDAKRRSPPLVYLGCHLQIRQLARGMLRKWYEGDAEVVEAAQQHEMFPGLQKRYPLPLPSRDAEPVYVPLESLSRADVIFNVNRLRREAKAKNSHADSLEAWGEQHRPLRRA